MGTLIELLDSSLGQDLAECDLDVIRTRRGEAQQAEVSLSYVRRVVQGHLDILRADLSRRQGGDQDVAALIEQLPAILTEREQRAGGNARPENFVEPEPDSIMVSELTVELDAALGEAVLADLADLPDERVTEAVEALESFEQRLSSQRALLHNNISALQEELVRRYKSGEANVDSLLT